MNEVERILTELQDIERILIDHGDLSDITAFNNNSSKAMLLAAASYFERRICETILNVCKNQSIGTIVPEFVSRQGLERKYHSLFEWNGKNANKLFSLFGNDFSKWIKNKIKDDDDIKKQIKEFLEIGNRRNQLVHNNYATYPLDSTYLEIWGKFQTALQFVDWLPSQFEEFEGAGS